MEDSSPGFLRRIIRGITTIEIGLILALVSLPLAGTSRHFAPLIVLGAACRFGGTWIVTSTDPRLSLVEPRRPRRVVCLMIVALDLVVHTLMLLTTLIRGSELRYLVLAYLIMASFTAQAVCRKDISRRLRSSRLPSLLRVVQWLLPTTTVLLTLAVLIADYFPVSVIGPLLCLISGMSLLVSIFMLVAAGQGLKRQLQRFAQDHKVEAAQ